METIFNYFGNQLTKRMKFTLFISFVAGLLIHLYIITNGLVNRDTMYNYYSPQDMSKSGRFTLTYLAGIGSYFDLHLVNGLLAILYLALSVTLLVELLNLESKLTILLTACLYIAFPTVSGIFAYMFTADGYQLGSLLAILSIFCIKKIKNHAIAIIAASLLIYLSLGAYQANLALVLTLGLVILVKDILDKNILLSFYVKSIISIIIGLGLYVIHFKLYEKYSKNGLTDYKGINESGKISSDHIVKTIDNALQEFVKFFFNSGSLDNNFEKFNFVYFIFLGTMLILFIILKKLSVMKIILLVAIAAIFPFITHIILFISPKVEYHILMKQNLSLLFVIGVLIVDRFYKSRSVILTCINLLFTFSIFLIAFNNIIITNIYYEKFDDVNKQTFSLMTQIAHDIRHQEGYRDGLHIIVLGTPTARISVSDRYNRVPENTGVSPTVIYDSNTFVHYMNNEIGLQINTPKNMDQFMRKHQDEINSLNSWPNNSSITLIEDTIVINLK